MPVTDLVRQSASCHGDGVFAQSVIDVGTLVLTMTGRIIDTAFVTDSMRAIQVSYYALALTLYLDRAKNP